MFLSRYSLYYFNFQYFGGSVFKSMLMLQVILTQSVDHPFSITIFEDKLFWSDWSGREIKVCNKFTGKNQKSLIRERKNKIYGMQIFHPSLFKSQVIYYCIHYKKYLYT